MLPAHVAVDRTLPPEAAVRHALGECASDRVGGDATPVRHHRALYPVFRVRYAYEEDGQFPWSGATTERGVALLDGLWADNHRHLQQYRESASAPDAVALDGYDVGEDRDGLGRTVPLDFRVTNERAAALLPERLEDVAESQQWGDPSSVTEAFAEDLWTDFDLPEELDAGTFAGVEDVSRLYLPIWIAEIERPDERDLFVAAREADEFGAGENSHGWFARFVGEDTSRLARYAHEGIRSSADAEPSDGDSSDGDDAGSEDTGRAQTGPADADRRSAPEEPNRIDETPDRAAAEPVQPDDVDLEASSIVDPSPDRSFADVGGMSDLKRRLRRSVIAPVEQPARYRSYGLDPVSGVLLHGPPGCGKTYVAGAIAGELDYAFLQVTPSDLTSEYMGKPAQNVADLFEIARVNQPCVLFLDEIDAIAGARDEQSATSQRQMVNQLLSELEAVADEDVLVLGATNLLDDVDDAVLRTGRFDERVEVGAPDADARREILRIHLEERPLADDLSLGPVVERTAGYAASDLEHVAETGARRALRAGERIDASHLLAAVEDTASSVPDWAGTAIGDGKTVTQPDGVDLSARALVTADVDRTFADVGGMADLKDRIRETVVDPLENADRYAEYGLDVTNGVLLHGPPGCGKTYLAGALAGELDFAFLDVTPSDLTSKWMGKPAQNVADLFEIARVNQPCVLFVDEIDAVAGARTGGSNASQRQMVNQLLAELEALDGDDVVVVAATNLLDDVDGAVLRSGRFDERIEVGAPDADARREILGVHLADRPVADAVSWDAVVEHTEGYAASDLALLADNAARRALQADEPVDEEHLLAALRETRSSIADWRA